MISKIILVTITILLVIFIYSLIEPYLVVIKKYQVSINKNEFKGKKFVFLSDFHYSEVVPGTYLKYVVKKVNSLNPELIILGGDYVSYSKKYIPKVFSILRGLKSNLGVYGVLGNHDIHVDKDAVLYHLTDCGFHSLDNKAYWITIGKDRIRLGGVADFMLDKPSLYPSLDEVKDEDYVIVVSHNPDLIEDVKETKIDLMLSGHTHGGQITFFGYAPHIPSLYKQRFKSGLITLNSIKLIVSNGIGCVGIPLRFFARPQIVLVEFI